MVKNADTARVLDVALMLGPLTRRMSGPFPEYFDAAVRLADDVWLGKHEMHERVLRACQSPGENWQPYHEFSIYAMWRTGGKVFVDGSGGFNNDRRLSTVMQLSRLVRPTSIGFTRAARIIEWDGLPLEIVPARAEGRGARIVVADPNDDWIRDEDVPEIARLIASFDPASLPERVKRAMMYFEYVHGIDDFNTRWPLIATSAEALVHTDERKKVFGSGGMRVTDQFIRRLLTLGQRVHEVTWTETDLDEAYEHRSGFAHGRGLGGSAPADVAQAYRSFEANVRHIIRSAILDPGLRAIFADDAAIRSALNP